MFCLFTSACLFFCSVQLLGSTLTGSFISEHTILALLTQDYPDYAVCDFLEFGWPVGVDYASSLSSARVAHNHKGAMDFPSAVDSYLSMELDRGAVIGPFAGNPFSRPIVVSPLNSVPKANSAERRMILDLSWPSGSSINDAIPDRIYLSQPYSLVYPTIDTTADRVASLGSGCLLFKRDLKRAYRQFPIDPFDYPLLGYQWNNELYFDIVLPMGLKVPVRSNFRKFIFVDFSKVYVAVTYLGKPFFDPSTGSPFFPMVFIVIFRPPLIGHVPTAQ